MRILTLTNLYPNPFQPDRATFNRQQVRALAARHAVEVIAPILWTDERLARRNGQARLPPDRRVVCDGLAVSHPRYLYTPKVLRSWYGRFFCASVRHAFRRALAEFRPDLVFAPWAYPDGWAAVKLGHRAHLPVVIKLHGSDVLSLDIHPSRQRQTIEALRRADGIVAVSQDLARRAVSLGAAPTRVRVVYDGVDVNLFHGGPREEARARLGLDPAEPIVLYIGNLVPVKGLAVLIDACARLAEEKVRFTCYLIGEGPLRGELEQEIALRGLAERMRFVGAKPHEQLPDWYRATDVLVLPTYSEGVPIVLLEAAACGTPFVASRVGGIPEIAHLGVSQLVSPGDAASLARAIAAQLAGSRQRSKSAPTYFRSHADAAMELATFLEEVWQMQNGRVHRYDTVPHLEQS